MPLSREHRDVLFSAASDGELWNSRVTLVPRSVEAMAEYIEEALSGQAQGRYLPFVIIGKAAGRVVGTTRYRGIERAHRRIEIGSTWLSASAQRTAVKTETKLLLLKHAFEALRCIRVEFLTDALNEQSREAILRLGARQEGILRQHMIMPDGRYRDSACYSIISSEWPEVKAGLEGKLRRNREGA
jgi:N-acetyltransferase